MFLLFFFVEVLIGFTLLYFKMAVIPLVPETKMADVGKLISLGNLLVRKIMCFLLTTTSTTLILSRTFGANQMTRISYIYSHLPRTNSLTFFTSRDSTLSLILSIVTSRDCSYSLSYILTSSSQPHDNVYILQPFSFLFCLFS